MLRFAAVAVTTAPRNGLPSLVLTTPLIDTDDDATSSAEVNRAKTKASKVTNKEILNKAQDFFRIVSPCGPHRPHLQTCCRHCIRFAPREVNEALQGLRGRCQLRRRLLIRYSAAGAPPRPG